MKTLVATVILAMAAASPALAQRARSAPQQGYQSQQNGREREPYSQSKFKGHRNLF